MRGDADSGGRLTDTPMHTDLFRYGVVGAGRIANEHGGNTGEEYDCVFAGHGLGKWRNVVGEVWRFWR